MPSVSGKSPKCSRVGWHRVFLAMLTGLDWVSRSNVLTKLKSTYPAGHTAMLMALSPDLHVDGEHTSRMRATKKPIQLLDKDQHRVKRVVKPKPAKVVQHTLHKFFNQAKSVNTDEH